MPGSWAGTLANLVHYKRHDRGGHFAVSWIELCVQMKCETDTVFRHWRSQRSFSKTLKRGFRRRGKLVAAPNFEHLDDEMSDSRLLSHRSDSRELTDRQTVSHDNDQISQPSRLTTPPQKDRYHSHFQTPPAEPTHYPHPRQGCPTQPLAKLRSSCRLSCRPA